VVWAQPVISASAKISGFRRRRVGTLDEREIGVEAKEKPTDGFEVELPPLELLGDRVDVTEAALEGIALKDGRGPRRVIHRVDDFLRLVDGKRCGQTDQHALLDGELAYAPDAAPDLVQRREEKTARRAQLRLALRHLRLDDRVLAQLALPGPWRLLVRERH